MLKKIKKWRCGNENEKRKREKKEKRKIGIGRGRSEKVRHWDYIGVDDCGSNQQGYWPSSKLQCRVDCK